MTGNYCVSRNALEMDGARIRRNNAQYLHVFFFLSQLVLRLLWSKSGNGHSLATLLGIQKAPKLLDVDIDHRLSTASSSPSSSSLLNDSDPPLLSGIFRKVWTQAPLLQIMTS